jgi:hypothetical protein
VLQPWLTIASQKYIIAPSTTLLAQFGIFRCLSKARTQCLQNTSVITIPPFDSICGFLDLFCLALTNPSLQISSSMEVEPREKEHHNEVEDDKCPEDPLFKKYQRRSNLMAAEKDSHNLAIYKSRRR